MHRNRKLDSTNYFDCYRNPVARIYPTMTVLNTKPAPAMAGFSSMGPNIITPDIIKVITTELQYLFAHAIKM